MNSYDRELLLSNLDSYLEKQGIYTDKLFKCINPNHNDTNASMKYFDNTKKVYCFGCKATYNLFDVIGIYERLDSKESFKRAIEYYGKFYSNKDVNKYELTKKNKKEEVIKDYSKAYKFWKNQLKNSKKAQNYLKNRGISEKTIEKFNIGFNEFDFGQFKLESVIIPVNNNCFTARNIVKSENGVRYYKPRGCHIDLFNINALTNNIPFCFVTEGEFDCLSFEEIGANCVGLSSVNNTNKFIRAEKDLNKTYIIALDNDEAGRNATIELINYFKENNIKYCVFDNCLYKDANEALVKDREKFMDSVKSIMTNIKNNQKTSGAEME